MDERLVDDPAGPSTPRRHRPDGLAEEVWASALLIGLAVLATVGVALLAHVLLRPGS
ncbi:MAG: hypothetical protein ACR2J0_09195 [Mycobacteriales bacterium]